MNDYDKFMIYLMLRDIKIPSSLGCGIILGTVLLLVFVWVLAKIMGY